MSSAFDRSWTNMFDKHTFVLHFGNILPEQVSKVSETPTSSFCSDPDGPCLWEQLCCCNACVSVCTCMCNYLYVQIRRCHRRSGVTEETDMQAAGWRQQPHACHDTPHAREPHTAAPTLHTHNGCSVPSITHQRQQQFEIFTQGPSTEGEAGADLGGEDRWKRFNKDYQTGINERLEKFYKVSTEQNLAKKKN